MSVLVKAAAAADKLVTMSIESSDEIVDVLSSILDQGNVDSATSDLSEIETKQSVKRLTEGFNSIRLMLARSVSRAHDTSNSTVHWLRVVQKNQ